MEFKRSSGILLHPTSFPSKYGIGDLGSEAYKFIDFLKEAKQSLWQVLPLGPTSFGDSPYQSFSTFAGNLLLISPDLLLEEHYLKKEDVENIPDFASEKVEFEKVQNYKKDLFKKAYENFNLFASVSQKASFNKFCYVNSGWLDDYALFVALKDFFIAKRKVEGKSKEYDAFKETYKEFFMKKPYFETDNESSDKHNNKEALENNTTVLENMTQNLETDIPVEKVFQENILDDYYFGGVWSTWPSELVTRREDALNAWKLELCEEIKYYKFLQYEFNRQWLELKEYANENDVKIIGDIPIFVAYDSADAWANPELFYFNSKGFPTLVAGVPPDYFSKTGQLWGNPLYNWDMHKSSNYKWWISRIKNILSLVDIVRIDHFRGFDEYFAIPCDETTAINGTWQKGPGIDLFNAIEATLGDLPIIAEDLGIITKSVEELKKQTGFPGMKILQFAFYSSDKERLNAYLPHNLEKNSVIYSGTHDNDTTQSWYELSDEEDKDYIRRYLNISGHNISWDFIRLAFSSVCNISIATMQDIMNLDTNARMNTPGTPSGNWQWRYTRDMLKDEYAESLAYLCNIFGR